MPNWLPKSRYHHLFVFRPDTEEAVRTRMVRRESAVFLDEEERRRLADGTMKTVRRRQGCAPEVLQWPAVDTLRTWRDEGAVVVAGLVKEGRGLHVVWDEPVPVLLDALDAPGVHQGSRLVLHTHKFNAAVYHDVSLLKAAEYVDNGDGTGTARIVLPLPGLTVYGIDETGYDVITIEAFGRGGAAKGTATVVKADIPNDFTTLTLPAGTVYVDVTGPHYGPGIKPLLTTVAPTVGEFVGGFEAGATGSTAGGNDYTTITPWGVGTLDGFTITRTIGGVVHTLNAREVGPPGLGRLLVHPHPTNRYGVLLITEPEPE